MAIYYQKATSGRLVLLISRFVHSLSLAILISEKSLGNHSDWVCAIDVHYPISFNKGIHYFRMYGLIGFLPIRMYIGSNKAIHPRAHHPVDLLHVQVLLHRPHAPPSGSLAPTTSSSTGTGVKIENAAVESYQGER